MSSLTFLIWLALVWGAGIAAFPLARRVLGANAAGAALPDAGLAAGRILFLASWTMLSFWLGQVGVSVAACAWLYAPLCALGLFVGWRDRAIIGQIWRAQRKTIVATEAIFLAVFLSFFLLRGFWSDTNGNNGEKSMDSALIGSLARAQYLPPANPYAAGARLNSYYYFGHLQTALLTRASGTSVRWSYNLMCATLPALCFAALFALGGALTRSNKGGLWVAGAILAGGTLQPLYQWTHLDIYSSGRFLGLDPFAVSRVIPYTINEFPWFTFNQADLHGHYFDFPFQIAALTLSWSLYQSKRIGLALVAALVLGAQIVTNTWDFPAFALLVGLSIVAVWGAFKQVASNEIAGLPPASNPESSSQFDRLEAGASPADSSHAATPKPKFAPRMLLALAVIIGALLVAAPFLLRLQSAANPPRWLHQPASPLREWLLLWGPIALGWWIFTAYSTFKNNIVWRATLLLMGAGIGVAAVFTTWQTPSITVLPLIIVSAGFAVAGAFANRGTERFLCLLAICGLVALGWSETTWAGFLGSADNLSADDFKRQDTVFKFGLQVWMLWGTASAAGAYLVIARGSKRLKTIAFAVVVPLALVMIAGNLSFTLHRVRFGDMMNARQNGGANWWRFDGWDGWAHMAPPERAAAAWLQANARPGENIVEAENKPGGDYTEFTRYAHATGIATIIGPQAHSFQWSPSNARMGRGQAARDAKNAAEWGEVFRRKTIVQRIYSPLGAAQRAQLLREFGVKYLVWGELERREYGEGAFANVSNGLREVARFGRADDPHRVVIFRLD